MDLIKTKRDVKRAQNTNIINEATAGMETTDRDTLTAWLERLKVTNVTCLFLPTFVRNDQLVQALAPYGKVIDVSYATYHRTATVKTGTRFIRMEMKEANPLPNFLRVAGHRATFDYRGLKRVCRRCRREGHVRAQCTTGYCDRCGVFGHPTEGCTANCRRCGGTHATVDCTAKRRYSSMVTRNHATDFPALDPGNATRPIAPEAPAVPTVSTVAPPSPPDAAAAAAPPPLPSPPPPAPPEPSPTGSGVTSAEATDSARTAAVIVGDTAYAAWSQASGDGEVSSDSDHLVIDENPAPGGPAETPTDSMDTTTTDTPESDSSRLTHEDSKRPLRSSGSRSTDRGWSFPCIELAAPLLALKTTLAILDDHDNPARPLTLYFLGANNRLLGDSLPSPLRPRAETTPAFYRSTADLFDKLSVHVSREEILEAPASRLVERLVVADQPPPPPGTVQPYPWLALTSSTLPDHVTNVTCLFLPTFVRNDQLVQDLAPYGKVTDVFYATYHRTATVKTGTRFIRMEMKEANPLPNFLRVVGHRATFHYRGLKRCGGTHATVDCTAKRRYSSMVTRNHATDFPALDPGNATSPIAPEAPAVPTVSTVAPRSPPDAAATAAPLPLPAGRIAAVVVGDAAHAAWRPASSDGEVSSDSDHLDMDENPAPDGPAATPTDSLDTTTTDTPESDSSRLPHEDSKRLLRSSGSRSTDSGGPRATCPKKPRKSSPSRRISLQHRPTAPRVQGSPSVHTEVLRYTHCTSLQAVERQQTLSASGSPGHLDNGRFAAHFPSLAQSDVPVDRNSVSSQPLLSGLPKISAEDDVGLRRPPSATELWKRFEADEERLRTRTGRSPSGFEDLLLTPSFRLGRIVLIPKRGGDHVNPGAWRPITLLNRDYKLLAATLASRLQAFLPELVNPRQTCSVSGRSIHTLTTLTRDILVFTRSRRANGLLVSLDQAKAFDRVEHQYLLGVLDGFGFTSESAQLFAASYSDFRSDLFLNGSLVARFPVTRGVRQGCPLPPALFVLSLEPFLVGVGRHPSITGLALPGSGELRVSAYADDVTLYLRNEDNLMKDLRLFDEYACLSGARLNPEKSKSLCIGAPPTCPPSLPRAHSVTILGVS
ncbi:hypothetical protein ISCGN_022440 [Ixodes scapularis]